MSLMMSVLPSCSWLCSNLNPKVFKHRGLSLRVRGERGAGPTVPFLGRNIQIRRTGMTCRSLVHRFPSPEEESLRKGEDRIRTTTGPTSSKEERQLLVLTTSEGETL